jgi:hypothetical protein
VPFALTHNTNPPKKTTPEFLEFARLSAPPIAAAAAAAEPRLQALAQRCAAAAADGGGGEADDSDIGSDDETAEATPAATPAEAAAAEVKAQIKALRRSDITLDLLLSTGALHGFDDESAQLFAHKYFVQALEAKLASIDDDEFKRLSDEGVVAVKLTVADLQSSNEWFDVVLLRALCALADVYTLPHEWMSVTVRCSNSEWGSGQHVSEKAWGRGLQRVALLASHARARGCGGL